MEGDPEEWDLEPDGDLVPVEVEELGDAESVSDEEDTSVKELHILHLCKLLLRMKRFFWPISLNTSNPK